MAGIAFLVFAELMTIPLTALICRYRLRRKKRISYGTMFAGAFLGAVLFVVSTSIYFNGWQIFSLDEWREDKYFGRNPVFTVLGCVTLMCVLPALGVVVYYERRHKKDVA
jgi:NADH:ubiquinone oxidoreductase subunit 4 (subunit M)